MQANLPSGGKPVGRSFICNREIYLWLIRSQLKCAEAKACGCSWTGLEGQGSSLSFWVAVVGFVHDLSPGKLWETCIGPQWDHWPLLWAQSIWGQYWAQKHCRTFGGTILFIPWTMSSDDLNGHRGGSGGWNKYLPVVCQEFDVPHLIQSSQFSQT